MWAPQHVRPSVPQSLHAPLWQRLLEGVISQLPPLATHTPFEQHPMSRHPKSGQQLPPHTPQGRHVPSLQNVKGAVHREPGQQLCCSLPQVGPDASTAVSIVASAMVPPPVPFASGAATSRSLPPATPPAPEPALVPAPPPAPPLFAPPDPLDPLDDASTDDVLPPEPTTTLELPGPVGTESSNKSFDARFTQPAAASEHEHASATHFECFTGRRLLPPHETSQRATAREKRVF
jgi:hypothetical protein